MIILKYALCITAAYIIGSSNMALYIAKLRGVNIRSAGSGNLGASNAMVTMGWGAGIIVALHDILKAVIPVLLVQHFFPELRYIAAHVGVAVVLGHIFPFYLRFKGGKGLASFFGMTLAMNWKFALIIAVAIIAITLITDYIAIGTVASSIIVPVLQATVGAGVIVAIILSLASIVIIFKHRDNYRRILAGTEIGFRRANRGDDRQV